MLSDVADRREKPADRGQIFDRLRANSRSYLSKRIVNMDRSDDFVADPCNVRQHPKFLRLLPLQNRLISELSKTKQLAPPFWIIPHTEPGDSNNE